MVKADNSNRFVAESASHPGETVRPLLLFGDLDDVFVAPLDVPGHVRLVRGRIRADRAPEGLDLQVAPDVRHQDVPAILPVLAVLVEAPVPVAAFVPLDRLDVLGHALVFLFG